MSTEELSEGYSEKRRSSERKRDDSTQLGGEPQTEHIEPISPEEFWTKYTDFPGQNDLNDNTLKSYGSAWRQFSEWLCTEIGEYLSDLPRKFPAEYAVWINNHNKYDKKALSLQTHLSRIEQITRTAEVHGYIENRPGKEVWNEIKPEITTRDDEIRNNPLDPSRIPEVDAWLKDNRPFSRAHVLWTLLTKYGLRASAIRAIDLNHLCLHEETSDEYHEDMEFQEHILLKDRPEAGPEGHGLPLKNTRDDLSERAILLQPEDVVTLGMYVRCGSKSGAQSSRKEFDCRDKFNRTGLITTEQSPRISHSTIQSRCHWLTCPTTIGSPCDCEGCTEYRSMNGTNPKPSQIQKICNFSRSPHQVRHGAITRMLDHYEESTVSEIVGTSRMTIKKVYDRADDYERMMRLTDDFLD